VLRSSPSMNPTPQREFWNANAVELETLWTLTKRGKVARLVLLTHQLGWELRIDSGDLLMTSGVQIGSGDRGRLGSVQGRDDREGLAVAHPRP